MTTKSDPRLRPSPLADASFVVRAFGDDTQQPIRFYVYQDVLDELVFAATYEERPVFGALLLGGFGVEEGRGFVEITGFAGATWVDKVEDLLPELRRAADEAILSHAGPITGLFVSESGGAGRITEEIARIHFSLFNVPFQAAVVFEPEGRLLGVFARAPGTRLFNAAFRAVAVRDASPLNPDAASAMTGDVGSEPLEPREEE